MRMMTKACELLLAALIWAMAIPAVASAKGNIPLPDWIGAILYGGPSAHAVTEPGGVPTPGPAGKPEDAPARTAMPTRLPAAGRRGVPPTPTPAPAEAPGGTPTSLLPVKPEDTPGNTPTEAPGGTPTPLLPVTPEDAPGNTPAEAPGGTPTPLLPVKPEDAPGNAPGPTEDPADPPTPTPAPSLRRARLRAVGDLMVHQRQLNCALGEDGTYDFHPQYAGMAEALSNADYTLANLETPVGDLGVAYSGYPVFLSPVTLLDAVKDAGIDFLTLANNHILDKRMEGLVATVENVDRLGFDHAGANRSVEERDAPVLAEVGGIRVGFLCYTEMTNGMENASREAREYGVNYMKDADLGLDVRRLRDAGAEVIIALPHWGVEYRRQPDHSTVQAAKRLVAAGADVVLGSHPHMVQPVEFVAAETGDGGSRTGLVAYSLGNFISNQGQRYTDSGILLDFTLAERASGGFDVSDVRVLPTFCWRRDELIQTLPALKYYDAPPEGMDDATWQRLRESVDEVRKLIDGGIPFIDR